MNLSLNNKITNLEIIVNETQISPINYLFKASSNFNSNKVYSAGNTIEFNSITFCYPLQSSFNIINFSYTIPKNGIYQFSYNIYLNSPPTTSNTRMAFYKNGIKMMISGSYASNIESCTTLEECNENDLIDVRYQIGPNITLFMATDVCSFCGVLLKEV